MKTAVQEQWMYNISLNDRTAFKEMFEYYYASLCVYAQRFVKRTDVCEDIVQDVFCAVWMNRHRLDYRIPAKNYLMAAVRNHCLNYLRDHRHATFDDLSQSENMPYAEHPDSVWMLDELEQLLADALAKLPPEYRMAFEMSRMEEQSVSEIAKAMDVSIRTVERYRNKAIEILKTELKDYLPLVIFILGFSRL
ncbi:MAG: RNA polymerase sigma-70 factor [Tannerella sp.]|jgi:RNA polymerase sigma-70 factor (ECF subfamily)|nr:RNA polymerase sigma-70 factor [Tannerella sp.]